MYGKYNDICCPRSSKKGCIMLEKMYFNEPRHADMNMYRCGIEDCKSGHSWGPAVRDHYIIHYVLGGKGSFTVGNTSYELSGNDGFLICPGTIVYYQADSTEPWSYGWVGFNGLKAAAYLKQAGLDAQNPVFRYEKDGFLRDCLMRMIDTKQLTKGKEIMLLGLLYEFVSQLVETADNKLLGKNNSKEAYVRKAMDYISMNYSRKITIAEIARHIGLDRSYLYSLFQEFLNVSPQDYLISFRMERACELMQSASLSIGSIACSVGYEDPLLFSKVFKKFKGLPPSEYKRVHFSAS